MYNENGLGPGGTTPSYLVEYMEELGLSDFLNYNILWNDFFSSRNWGQRKNGEFVLIDEGALNKDVTATSKVPDWAKEEWEQIKSKRRTARKAPKVSYQLTPAQKEFFKDTKVVDSKGEPKVVYHGTSEDFDAFYPGSYFTSSPEYASQMAMEYSEDEFVGQNVKAVYLNIKNPKRYKTVDDYEDHVMIGPGLSLIHI